MSISTKVDRVDFFFFIIINIIIGFHTSEKKNKK